MKNKLLKFGRWAETNWIQIVVIVGLFLMLELALVFSRGLLGTGAMHCLACTLSCHRAGLE